MEIKRKEGKPIVLGPPGGGTQIAAPGAQQAARQHAGAQGIVGLSTADLKEAFALIDKNGDGHLDLEELRSVMQSLGQTADPKEIAAMVKEFDTDGNGTIDCDEFVKIMLDQMSLTHEEGMKKLWTALDKDNDGFINPADVREVMTNTGMKLSHEEVDDMMRYAGIFDESTPINVQQFRKLMMAT